MNHSELIFNQKISCDNSKRHRWFRKDAEADWMLSSKNECWICQRYHYTIVFYDRSSAEKNQGLIEIKDPEFLSKLKREYDENIERYKTD